MSTTSWTLPATTLPRFSRALIFVIQSAVGDVSKKRWRPCSTMATAALSRVRPPSFLPSKLTQALADFSARFTPISGKALLLVAQSSASAHGIKAG